MGMFDSVHVPCAGCARKHDIQTKAGECSLTDYSLADAPKAVLDALNGETFWCDDCGAMTRIEVITIARAVRA